MNLKAIAKGTKAFLKKNNSKFLLGFGISGGVTAAIFAVKATPKAMTLIQERKEELNLEEDEKLDAKEVILTVWKEYIPAAVIGGVSILCLIGSHSANTRRNAALATAYTISESAFREYRDKAIDIVGEAKEKEIRDAIAKDKIQKNPVSHNEVHVTQKGNTLIYEPLSGRYFKGDIEKIRRAVNELNRDMISNTDPFGTGFVTLNDFYILIGLAETQLGDTLGWNFEVGMIEVWFSAQVADNDEPCLVLNFNEAPRYDFNR